MTKISFVIAVIIFAMPMIGQAQMPQEVSYNNYLREVLHYYPSLKKQYANIEKALREKALAASSRMPHFWASANFDYGNDPVYVFGALLRQNRFSSDDFSLNRLNSPDPMSNNSASIEGQWLLFDFSQTAAHIKSAGLLAESAQYQAQLTKMEAILAASEVYSRLALTQELLKVLDEVTADGSSDVDFAQTLSKKGFILGADFYLARMTQTRLMQSKNEVMAQEAALSMAFNILRGQDPAMPVQVNVDFKKQLNLNGTAQKWISKAMDQRLDIKVMGKLLEAQGVEAKSEKTSFLPRISAYGQGSENTHGIGQSGGQNFMIGLKATMDIFDPGYGDRVKLAKAETDRLANEYQEVKDEGAKETAQTFYRLQALKSNEELAVKALDDARQASCLTVPLYREGRRSIEQMLAMRAGLVETYEQWLKLENAYRQNILSLKFYTGELDEKEAEHVYGQ